MEGSRTCPSKCPSPSSCFSSCQSRSMRQRSFASATKGRRRRFQEGSQAQQLCGLLLQSRPHSMRSHSSSRGTLRSKSRVRGASTDAREARDRNRLSALPSRQEIISKASAGSESARPSTDWGWWSGLRTMRSSGAHARTRADRLVALGWCERLSGHRKRRHRRFAVTLAVLINAQIVRAVLFAKATAATFFARLASSWVATGA